MAGARPLADCERFLELLTTDDDGGSYELTKVLGDDVPPNMEVYFCKRTFDALHIHVHCRDDTVEHDYGVADPNRESKFELSCRRSNHRLRARVQQSLGFQELLPPPPYASACEVSEVLQTLWAVIGLYDALQAFSQNPDLESLPLPSPTSAKAATSRSLLHLSSRPAILFELVELTDIGKHPCFAVPQTGMPCLRLVDPSARLTRGLLLKSLVETKWLVSFFVTYFSHGDLLFNDANRCDFRNILEEVSSGCCRGGVAAQFCCREESWSHLRHLFCGATGGAP